MFSDFVPEGAVSLTDLVKQHPSETAVLEVRHRLLIEALVAWACRLPSPPRLHYPGAQSESIARCLNVPTEK